MPKRALPRIKQLSGETKELFNALNSATDLAVILGYQILQITRYCLRSVKEIEQCQLGKQRSSTICSGHLIKPWNF